jgi:hypothetical protein
MMVLRGGWWFKIAERALAENREQVLRDVPSVLQTRAIPTVKDLTDSLICTQINPQSTGKTLNYTRTHNQV